MNNTQIPAKVRYKLIPSNCFIKSKFMPHITKIKPTGIEPAVKAVVTKDSRMGLVLFCQQTYRYLRAPNKIQIDVAMFK
jgi:hypothetical protein